MPRRRTHTVSDVPPPPPAGRGLKAQRDWYAYQAENGTPDDRPLWRQLADEATARLEGADRRWAPADTLEGVDRG